MLLCKPFVEIWVSMWLCCYSNIIVIKLLRKFAAINRKVRIANTTRCPFIGVKYLKWLQHQHSSSIISLHPQWYLSVASIHHLMIVAEWEQHDPHVVLVCACVCVCVCIWWHIVLYKWRGEKKKEQKVQGAKILHSNALCVLFCHINKEIDYWSWIGKFT